MTVRVSQISWTTLRMMLVSATLALRDLAQLAPLYLHGEGLTVLLRPRLICLE